MFKVEITSRAHRELKKLSMPLKERIILEAAKLSENPELGKTLSNPFVSVRSHHFTFEGRAYNPCFGNYLESPVKCLSTSNHAGLCDLTYFSHLSV